MYSIGQLCREFNLSRSTLLYYDSIGLLIASERTAANYRQYSETDRKSLSQICAFREAGVPLNQVKNILDTEGMRESDILEKRLWELNDEIRYLRLQQRLIVDMLKVKNLSDKKMLMDSQTFVSILESIGFDEKIMYDLHVQFEKNSPDAHQFFLEFLGVEDEEIKIIRELGSQEEKEKE